MKALEARDLATAELQDKLRELKEELFNLRFQLATGQLDNHKRLGAVRRETAMIKTIIRERELEEEDALAMQGATEQTSE